MIKKFVGLFVISQIIILGLVFAFPHITYAEEEQNNQSSGASDIPLTSISLTPVSKNLQLIPNTTNEDILNVRNTGTAATQVEVYTAPYSYVYSEDTDLYQLGFAKENNYTQITRWISFKDASGNYVKNATFMIEPGETLPISYKVTVPENIPAGGQYGVIFVHTISNNIESSGIRTEASPGMVIYGKSSVGESVIEAEIRDLSIAQTNSEDNAKKVYSATAKVKNLGNVDFNARGILKVTPIIGPGGYETPENQTRTSVIPESELVVSDTWSDVPSFGIYNITWTVEAGESTETVEKVVFVISPYAIIIVILVLTFIIVMVIIIVRKRKEHRSRLAV